MSSTAAGRSVGVHFDGDLSAALIDAAAEVIGRDGVERLSLRGVARDIGVSHAAPAHHFGDKTGLLTAVATVGYDLLTAELTAGRDDVPDRPADQLPALGRAYAGFAERYPGHFDVMFRPALLRMRDQRLREASDRAYAVLAQCVRRWQQCGWRPYEDPDTLTAASWALAHGISTLRATGALARHHQDMSLETVGAIVDALAGP